MKNDRTELKKKELKYLIIQLVINICVTFLMLYLLLRNEYSKFNFSQAFIFTAILILLPLNFILYQIFWNKIGVLLQKFRHSENERLQSKIKFMIINKFNLKEIELNEISVKNIENPTMLALITELTGLTLSNLIPLAERISGIQYTQQNNRKLILKKLNDKITFYTYKKDDKINFIISSNNHLELLYKIRYESLGVFSVDISKIDYYTVMGNKHHISEISGGGVSIGGAIVGGLIAGDVGTIVGGRKGISTQSRVIDDREVKFYFNFYKKYLIFTFNYNAYDAFKRIIPQKDLLTKQGTELQTNKTFSDSKKLEEYFKLKEKGIITEDEFEIKKREILNKK